MKSNYACLMYHEILSPSKTGCSVSPENFKQQIDWLVSNGYKSIDLRTDFVLTGKDVLITFDDGHKSNLEAARYLKEKGLVAVFYLIKDYSLNNPAYLNEDDIKEIASMGHIIGVHGKNHLWWTKKPKKQLVAELDETAKWIETLTGQLPVTCSGPGGLVRKKDYRTIHKNLPYLKYVRTSFHDYNSSSDTYLSSMGIGTNTEMEEFAKIVSMDSAYYRKLRTKCWIKDRLKDIVYLFKKQNECALVE